MTDVIETDSGYYVAKVTSTFDQTATDNKKQQIISERENDCYNEIVEGWKDDTKIKENKDVWKKIDFNEQGVAVKKAEDDSDSTDNSTSKDSTDEENTDDSENTDNTDNAEEAAE